MAFKDIQSTLDQYAQSLPWQESRAAAQSALDAVRYLLVARLQHLADTKTMMSYETLQSEKKALEKFLGATAPRSFGRSRRNGVSFKPGGIG